MTDLENLQKQEHAYEEAEHQRQREIIDQITDLFQRLSPESQANVLEILAADEYLLSDDLLEDDDA